MINKNEKRKRQLRIAARKRQERLEYREKYGAKERQYNEEKAFQQKLESDKKKAQIECVIVLILSMGLGTFFLIYPIHVEVGLPFIVISLVLCAGLIFVMPWMYGNYTNRCYFVTQLAEKPILPVGVAFPCIPDYYYDISTHKDELCRFEQVKKEVFTHCSAKRVVITSSDRGSLSWIVSTIVFFVMLYSFGQDICNDWKSGETLILLSTILCFLSSAVFLYFYEKKNIFIIDRENKMITIPPVYRFGKEKIVPYDQVVVSFRSGTIPIPSRCRSRALGVHDYVSLTAKENLPFGPRVGFRCDVYTHFRFARFICEYMNVADLEDMPEIEGFEDIISKIKQDNALRNKPSYGFPT